MAHTEPPIEQAASAAACPPPAALDANISSPPADTLSRFMRLTTSMAAIIFELTAEGAVLFVNDAVTRITGYAPAELLGKNWWSLLCTGENKIRAEECRRRCLRRDVRNYELTLTTKDGESVTVEINTANCYASDGALQSIVAFGMDIGERKRTEARVRQVATVFDNTGEGIIIMDTQRKVLTVNRAFTEITGYGEEEVIGTDTQRVQLVEGNHEFYREQWETLQSRGRWQGELWKRRKNGEVYPVWESVSAVNDDSGRVSHYIALFTDISAIKSSEKQLYYLAHHDPLTGVPNRLLFAARLESAMERAKRRRERLALLFLDLDRFKWINDSLGHPEGDRLLQIVATRLKKCVRAEDTVARLGGDEFTVILEEIAHAEDAAILAGKIIDAVAQPIALGSRNIATSTSIGIGIYPDDGINSDDLIKAADAAMYHAKARGRDNYQFYTPHLNRRAFEHLSLEKGLQQAVARDELALLYQPLVALNSGAVVGVETFVRWRHPQLGMVPAETFIPLAEDSGHIDAVEEWVLRNACRQACTWRAAGLPLSRIAINLSVHQIQHRDVAQKVEKVLNESGVRDCGLSLELEINERYLSNGNGNVFQRLKDLGVGLALDDFGTGCSSLGDLQQLPVDSFKIDRSFVHASDSDDTIIAAIVALGHTLGKKVVGEGVETADQLGRLRTRHCDEIQGNLFSEPLAADDLAALVASGKRL